MVGEEEKKALKICFFTFVGVQHRNKKSLKEVNSVIEL